MESRRRIIGIDPGSRMTGFGVVDVHGQAIHLVRYGVVRLSPKASLAERLGELFAGLNQVMVEAQPDVMAVEQIFYGKNVDSAFKLGHARGVALLMAAQHGCEVAEYATRLVKKCITGSGASDKEQVQRLVLQSFRLRETTTMALDASDALAVALAHARIGDQQQMIRQQIERAEESL